MPILSEVCPRTSVVLRDAEVDATNFVGRGSGRVLYLAASPDYIEAAVGNSATAAVVVTPELAEQVPETVGVVADEDPVLAFYQLHNRLAEIGMRVRVEARIDPEARIHPAAQIEDGCQIGRRAIIEAGAIIHSGTIVEEGALIGSGSIIGGDGHLTVRRGDYKLHAKHVGGVRIGRDAEIHSGCIIQRDAFVGFTEIGPRTVLVSGCKVTHGVSVGSDCTMALGAQISGYSTIGDRVFMGPGAVVSNLITVGDDARIEIGAVVVRSVKAGARYSGWFARPHDRMRAMSAALEAAVPEPNADPRDIKASGTQRGSRDLKSNAAEETR
jgi:UDP-3-O-[3-hydroxymyristoyl] glucosamine N-acyltransferase